MEKIENIKFTQKQFEETGGCRNLKELFEFLKMNAEDGLKHKTVSEFATIRLLLNIFLKAPPSGYNNGDWHLGCEKANTTIEKQMANQDLTVATIFAMLKSMEVCENYPDMKVSEETVNAMIDYFVNRRNVDKQTATTIYKDEFSK